MSKDHAADIIAKLDRAPMRLYLQDGSVLFPPPRYEVNRRVVFLCGVLDAAAKSLGVQWEPRGTYDSWCVSWRVSIIHPEHGRIDLGVASHWGHGWGVGIGDAEHHPDSTPRQFIERCSGSDPTYGDDRRAIVANP